MDNLKGIKILSFNHFLMGPLGIQFLADLGADVITIEPPQGAFQRKWGAAGSKRVNNHTMMHIVSNRNKRSLALYLKKEESKKIIFDLVKETDVVAENFRPGTLDKLGLGYSKLKSLNPEIIYATANGFGSDGPYKDKPGQDLIAQAMSGLSMITSKSGDLPRLVGASVVDHHGAMIYSSAILAALVKKIRTGKGGIVEVNLLKSAINLQAESIISYLNGEKPKSTNMPENIGSWYHEAPYGTYKTKDGYIAISLVSLELLFRSLNSIDKLKFKEDEAYTKRNEISKVVAEIIINKTNKELIDTFDKNKIWYSEIYNYEKLIKDPQVIHNKDIETFKTESGENISLITHPVKYDGNTPKIKILPQNIGAQTKEILKDLNYTEDEINKLSEDKVIKID